MDLATMEYGTPKTAPSFSPYDSNEGSIVAIAGKGFMVIASDSRLSNGYSIYTRNQPKLFKLSNKTVMGCAGCWCDVLTLTRVVGARMKMYLHEHNKEMSTKAVGQLTSTLMYYKRFFPYYVYTILAGLDENGDGELYSYDSVGHKNSHKYVAGGAAAHMLQPFLDNQVGFKNNEDGLRPDMTIERATAIIKDSYISATERDIYTGDSIILNIITKDGIQELTFPLRRD